MEFDELSNAKELLEVNLGEYAEEKSCVDWVRTKSSFHECKTVGYEGATSKKYYRSSRVANKSDYSWYFGLKISYSNCRI
jgi:hypothetical protein